MGKLSLQQYIEKHGTRKTAQAILNRRIQKFIFLGLEDLPDTSELCEVVDAIEDVFINGEMPFAKDQIKDILRTVDFEFIQNQI